MSILSDFAIKTFYRGMLDPFVDHQVSINTSGNKIISYGLSSYGYDIRLANEFKFMISNLPVIDPKDMSGLKFFEVVEDYILIPPQSCVLARSLEYIKIPRDILCICMGKSTYARCGLIVNITPLEPEWEGYLTLELSNTTSIPIKVYANEGIAQLMFLTGTTICKVSYADKKGKYQGQTDVTIPKV